MAVFVLDRRKQPLMPCSERRARILLRRGRARVARYSPFTIRLIDRDAADSQFQSIAVTIDPGSKGTGIAVSRKDTDEGPTVRRHGMIRAWNEMRKPTPHQGKTPALAAQDRRTARKDIAMLTTLVLVYCMSGQPDQCVERPEPIEGGLMACQIQAQQMAQDWLAWHPKYALAKFRCMLGRRDTAA